MTASRVGQRLLTPAPVRRALRHALMAELNAPKPGNVSFASPGHGMTAADFVRSADAVVPVLCIDEATVGQRIHAAVRHTRDAVGCNTNLGIVLLCAPLAHAALAPQSGGGLRARLEAVLAGLNADDAALAYRAIRLAAPGGLGISPAHDVRDEPTVSLREAMAFAAPRDRIALQYATGYRDIFEIGIPRFVDARREGGGLAWAVLSVYLDFLARFPDTHVARRHGTDVAEAVRREAETLQDRRAGERDLFHPKWQAFDERLKRAGINPGTTADLTVAVVFAAQLAARARALRRTQYRQMGLRPTPFFVVNST